MSARKSQPRSLAQAFGQRVREARERRGWTQGELAERVHLDRTTLNKIERGTRGDVSISQLFTFAAALGIAPVHLLTPRLDDRNVELTKGGPVMSPTEARAWIRGEQPEGTDTVEWFLDLPRDEQRQVLERASETRHGVDSALTRALVAERIEDDVARWLRALERREEKQRKEARDG